MLRSLKEISLLRHRRGIDVGPQQAFLYLSLHAKMHKQLDALEERKQGALQRIERAEIRAYDDEADFRKLEDLKKELMAISFMADQ
jgi:hypothetical protein